MNKLYYYFKQNFHYFCFFFIFILFLKTFFISYFNPLGDRWAYQELFINYSGGFIRRGLLGELYLTFNNFYQIEPNKFFSLVFIVSYLVALILYFNLLKKIKDYYLIFIFIVFSPSLILFNIYDQNTFLTKDIFSNLSILIHAVYINTHKNDKDLKKYNKFLLFVVIPILFINIINHEMQFFFVGIHLLFTLYNYDIKKVNQKQKKLFPYFLTLVPLILIFFFPGSWEKVDIINDSISNFDVKINNQLAGNINLAIGGFIKWHFFYHGIESFINLFICLILTIVLFITIGQFLIKERIIFLSPKLYLFAYIAFLLPFSIFILAVDHGRTINLILTHLISFFFIMNINHERLKSLYIKIREKIFIRNLILLFIFFYIFLWYLPQGGGYSGIGDFNADSSLFKNTLFKQFSDIFMIIYNFIDDKVIQLPKVII